MMTLVAGVSTTLGLPTIMHTFMVLQKALYHLSHHLISLTLTDTCVAYISLGDTMSSSVEKLLVPLFAETGFPLCAAKVAELGTARTSYLLLVSDAWIWECCVLKALFG